MELIMPLCHPFYFPTQVVLVDDNGDFLEGISVLLGRGLGYQLFRSAHQALEYVNIAQQHVAITQRCYSCYKTGPLESDNLTHIDINQVHHEVYNPARFQTPSVVVVDYAMPEMNGLEFCCSLTNPYIKKILLTGQADIEVAVEAFNDGIIDQFITKKDPQLKYKLNKAIRVFQEQYFAKAYKLITDPIIANNHSGYLLDLQFHDFFQSLRKRLDAVEYYIIDQPFSGFLLVDAEGICHCLYILTQENVDKHLKEAQAQNASEELITQLKSHKLVPIFNCDILYGNAGPLEDNDKHFTDWKRYHYPATKVQAKGCYYCVLAPAMHMNSYQLKKVYSYSRYMQTLSRKEELVH